MRKALGGMLFGLAVLSGCGGGGGDDDLEPLYVTVTYPTVPISLYHPVTITPLMAGFQGYVPQCWLTPGSVLPNGLQLRSDCVIEGRATESAFTRVNVRVGAARVVNTIDVNAEIQVNGPSLIYPDRLFLGTLPIGTLVNDDPRLGNWTAAPDLSMSWTYSLTYGTLPPGLSLDPVSGRVTGTTQTGGSYWAQIRGTLQTQFGTFQTNDTNYSVNVDVPTLTYTSGTTAWVSQPYSLAPQIFGVHLPDATISGASFTPALPAGLSVNDAGVISGLATTVQPGPSYHGLQATLNQGGASAPTQGSLTLSVRSPVSHEYESRYASVGVPFDVSPTMTLHSPVPLEASATRVFSPQPNYCWLPPSLSIDPASGTVSGTPADRGGFSCHINVRTTNQGVSWDTQTHVSIYVQ